jgi:XTP/dITP diphosphohydrolase
MMVNPHLPWSLPRQNNYCARGANGFGFDPIFLNEEKNLTNAEMTLAEKNQVSHRGQAWRLAKEILKQEF